MMTAERLLGIVETKADKLVELAQALIRIPTVNDPPNGNETPGQEFLEEYARRIGAETDLFTLDQVPGLREDRWYHPGRDATGRPDLVARWKGSSGGRSLMLAGHIDVVGIGNRLTWNDDPFGGRLHDDRIWGRGAGDMKGGLAAELIAIESALELGRPRGDIVFASAVDEEFGGMNGTLAVVRRGYRADAAILAEPTGLDLFPATGGGLQYRIHAQGRRAFEGRKDQGQCAILRMAKIVQALDELERRRSRRFKDDRYFGGYPVPTPICITGIEGGDVTVGGVADSCWIELWHQALPGESEQDVIGEVQFLFDELATRDAWLAEHRPRIEPRCKWMDPCAVPDGHPFLPALAEAWSRVMRNRPVYRGMMGATDASRLQLAAGIATVNFGPGGIDTHLPNENVAVDELVKAAKVMALAIAAWCGVTDGPKAD